MKGLSWTRYDKAVLTGVYVASDPSIIEDDGLYRMFYTDGEDVGGVRPVIREALSTDGLNWMPVGGNATPGVIVRGVPGTDHANLETAGAFKAGTETVLLYAAYADGRSPMAQFPSKLYAVRSSDGETFEAPSATPILTSTPGWYDNDGIFSPTVVSRDGGYLMVYAGHAYGDTSLIDGKAGVHLLAAVSQDGTRWTKQPLPVLEADPAVSWMKDGVAEPSLVAGPDGTYYLFFTGLSDDRRTIGVATASDPLGTWQVDPEPILQASAQGFDDASVIAPHAEFVNGALRIWYTGVSQDGQWSIGLAQAGRPDGAAAADQGLSSPGLSVPTWIGSGRADTITDGATDSVTHAGAGNDTVAAGAGNDTVLGEAGDDVLWGEAGSDSLIGGAGADLIDGGIGADTLLGGAGDDTLSGQDGTDLIDGGDGADWIGGGAGADMLTGGAGNDVIEAGAGQDTVQGGDGDDAILGGAGDDLLEAGDGVDSLFGGAGHDTLIGGDGADWLYGGDVSEATGAFLWGSGNDWLRGGAGGDALFGLDGNDRLDGEDGIDHIEGGSGRDTLSGGAGDDVLFGQDGHDLILGGAGDDNLYGGAGADTFAFVRGDGHDVIRDFSRTEGDRLRLDPSLGITSYAAFRNSITGFSADGVDYTILSFVSGDDLTIVGIKPADWTGKMVSFG